MVFDVAKGAPAALVEQNVLAKADLFGLLREGSAKGFVWAAVQAVFKKLEAFNSLLWWVTVRSGWCR